MDASDTMVIPLRHLELDTAHDAQSAACRLEDQQVPSDLAIQPAAAEPAALTLQHADGCLLIKTRLLLQQACSARSCLEL